MNALYQTLAPTIDRMSTIMRMAQRARIVNEALHTSMTPFEIDRDFADEDIDLLIAWMEHRA